MRETIQRYEAYYKNDFNDTLLAMLQRDDDGDLVLYSDHIERIAKAEARNKVLEEALRGIVADFECDYVIDGKVVDEPTATHRMAWETARAALREDR